MNSYTKTLLLLLLSALSSLAFAKTDPYQDARYLKVWAPIGWEFTSNSLSAGFIQCSNENEIVAKNYNNSTLSFTSNIQQINGTSKATLYFAQKDPQGLGYVGEGFEWELQSASPQGLIISVVPVQIASWKTSAMNPSVGSNLYCDKDTGCAGVIQLFVNTYFPMSSILNGNSLTVGTRTDCSSAYPTGDPLA